MSMRALIAASAVLALLGATTSVASAHQRGGGYYNGGNWRGYQPPGERFGNSVAGAALGTFLANTLTRPRVVVVQPGGCYQESSGVVSYNPYTGRAQEYVRTVCPTPPQYTAPSSNSAGTVQPGTQVCRNPNGTDCYVYQPR